MNQVALIGRITRSLTLRTTNNGKSYVFFNIAVNESKDRTDFINCVAWNKVAENMAKFTGKGSLISVAGKISTRKDNNDQYITEVLANSVTFLDNKKRDNFDNDYSSNSNYVSKTSEPAKKVNIDEAFNELDTEINFINNDNVKKDNSFEDDDEAIIWD